MTAATRAPVRVGLADAREGATWFYTDRVDASRLRVHAVERTRRVAAAFGASDAEPQFDLPISAEDTRWAGETLATLPVPRIVLEPRGTMAHEALASRAFRRNRAAALVASISGRLDRGRLGRRSAARSGPPCDTIAPIQILDLCGRTNLHQLAALSAESDVLISNDTGPLHLAAAAGARVVGIYTCTNPASDRSVRPARDDRADRHLVQVQPEEDLRSDGVHERADARPGVAGRRAADRAGDATSESPRAWVNPPAHVECRSVHRHGSTQPQSSSVPCDRFGSVSSSPASSGLVPLYSIV